MKRGRSDVASAEVARVTDHYSGRPDVGVQARALSQIRHLRNFNNWVKSVLISLYLSGPGMSVLDLAGGKGGDLNKWHHGNIGHLVLADAAHGSVEDARKRYLTAPENHAAAFPALFISADCYGARICQGLDPELQFDLVSCQFAFHYAFETEERLRMALLNVSDRLRPGGVFCGTVPNSYRLVHLLRHVRGLSWSNPITAIEFDEATDKDCLPEFGARYLFSLAESVDRVPEYLVHFAVLQRIALEYNLELVMREEFPDFYKRHGQHIHVFFLLFIIFFPQATARDLATCFVGWTGRLYRRRSGRQRRSMSCLRLRNEVLRRVPRRRQKRPGQRSRSITIIAPLWSCDVREKKDAFAFRGSDAGKEKMKKTRARDGRVCR